MCKKLWGCVILCLFVFSLGVFAEEKVPVIEHIYWGFGGLFDHTILTTPAAQDYESEPFFRFHVPPSPKSDLIFFEMGCQPWIKIWPGYLPRRHDSFLRLRMLSTVIPNDLEVVGTVAMMTVTDKTFPVEEGRPNKTSYTATLERDYYLRQPDLIWLEVKSKVPGGYVSNDVANRVLNALIDNGCDVNVSVCGKTEGIQEFQLVSAWIHVTRTTKK
jgi:hypothetical protein